jgi:hypothetical protein
MNEPKPIERVRSLVRAVIALAGNLAPGAGIDMFDISADESQARVLIGTGVHTHWPVEVETGDSTFRVVLRTNDGGDTYTSLTFDEIDFVMMAHVIVGVLLGRPRECDPKHRGELRKPGSLLNGWLQSVEIDLKEQYGIAIPDKHSVQIHDLYLNGFKVKDAVRRIAWEQGLPLKEA